MTRIPTASLWLGTIANIVLACIGLAAAPSTGIDDHASSERGRIIVAGWAGVNGRIEHRPNSLSGQLVASRAKAEEVEAVCFELHEITDDDIAALRSLPKLRRVSVCGSNTTNATIRQMSRLSMLREASIYNGKIADGGLRPLASLKNLEKLSISLPPDTGSDAGIASLGELTALRELRLHVKAIDDEELSFLLKLTKLRSLDLYAGGVTDAGLSHLRELVVLEHLELRCPQITGRGLSNLAHLKSLKSLALGGKVDDAALEGLQALTKLESLDLLGGHITDAGLDRLMPLTSLKHLNLRDAAVTEGKVKLLQAKLPHCRIERSKPLP
jgi:hypothetical protein